MVQSSPLKILDRVVIYYPVETFPDSMIMLISYTTVLLMGTGHEWRYLSLIAGNSPLSQSNTIGGKSPDERQNFQNDFFMKSNHQHEVGLIISILQVRVNATATEGHPRGGSVTKY